METQEQLKARLLLERQTAGVFQLFFQHAPTLIGQEFTILAFDSGDAGHVAYKTSLTPEWLIRSFERLLASWSISGPPLYAPPGITGPLVRDIANAIKKALPPHLCFAIVIGIGDRMAYVGTAERHHIKKLVETELLPQWRKEMVS